MIMKDIDILLGKGFENILFGMPKELVENTLGIPNSVHIDNYKKDDQYERWEYLELKTDLWFHKDEGDMLDSIETENSLFLLNGHKIIGMELTNFEKIISEFDFSDLTKDEEQEKYSSERKSINIWYEEEVISSIQWGYLFDKEDEPIIPYKL